MRVVSRDQFSLKLMERKDLIVFIVLFFIFFGFVLWAVVPLLRGAPTLDQLHRVYGTVERIDKLDRWRRSDVYHIVLNEDGHEKVYSFSQFYRTEETKAMEKIASGDLIQLYLEDNEPFYSVSEWVDGSVYGIYDRHGKALHPIEISWKARRNDCVFGLCFFGTMEALCGLCIYLLVRHPKLMARLNRWSESVPKSRYIEFGRKKRRKRRF